MIFHVKGRKRGGKGTPAEKHENYNENFEGVARQLNFSLISSNDQRECRADSPGGFAYNADPAITGNTVSRETVHFMSIIKRHIKFRVP